MYSITWPKSGSPNSAAVGEGEGGPSLGEHPRKSDPETSGSASPRTQGFPGTGAVFLTGPGASLPDHRVRPRDHEQASCFCVRSGHALVPLPVREYPPGPLRRIFCERKQRAGGTCRPSTRRPRATCSGGGAIGSAKNGRKLIFSGKTDKREIDEQNSENPALPRS